MTLTIQTLTGETKIIPNVAEFRVDSTNIWYRIVRSKHQKIIRVAEVGNIDINTTLEEVAEKLLR